ncbi:MAG: GDP-mannose 4,6-dehydratase [Treponema sp.]|nr:GDP-mannose 4,6-dehydratase [Treponema sp.]
MGKALVLGAAGFVGGYLIDCLKNEFGMEVYGTKISSQVYAHEGARIFDLDILDKEKIVSLFKEIRPDCIFHLAAQSSVSISWKNPQLTVDINIKGALNVLEALRELDYRPRIILVGSGEEYGPSGADLGKIGEETLPKPVNIYAATKATQNMFGSIYSKAYGLDVISVRAFNHIGPGQAATFVISDFCKQVAEIEAGKKESVIYVGNLSAYRDFTDVRDVVRAYALLSQSGRTGETYNVGSGHAMQVRSLLDKILSLSDRRIEVRVDENKMRPVDVPKIEADISKLCRETGWEIQHCIDDTIKDVLDWWRKICK